ncbi:MAG TPA: polysaccharide biosynthesis tyrosine autokinase [Mycobacteriales bacterium]|nr:polysaccharide biosynthesis tyrosine autokinase [Mycobacteriales bacterium]
MELIDYLHIVRRRMVLILVIMVACTAGAGVATAFQTTTYQASVRLIVSGASNVSDVDEIARRQLAVQNAVAFAQVAGTGPAVKDAITAAAADGPFKACAYPQVSANADGTDPFVNISVIDCDPRQAAAVANAYVKILPTALKQLDQVAAAVPEEIVSLGAAPVPAKPYSPRFPRNLLIGFIVGLVIGLVTAFVREGLDRRLRDSDEVEGATGAPILGVIPSELDGVRTPVLTHPMSARAEAYRKVRTNLTFAGPGGMPKALLITSAVSGEGKTTLATNLALACARTGQRVALVDADLRRPMVSSYLDVKEGLGVTSVLTGDTTLEQAMTTIDDGRIHVLGSGPIPSNPSELLGSARMTAMVAELVATHDVVIIDAPPVLPVADALVLVSEVDAVVLVAKVGETTRDRLKQATEAVLQVHGNLVGIVPNSVVQREDSAYAYAYRSRTRKGVDSLTLYTKQARTPEIDVSTEEFAPLDEPAPVSKPKPVSKREPVPVVSTPEPLAAKPEPVVSAAGDKQREIAARIEAAFAAASKPDSPASS